MEKMKDTIYRQDAIDVFVKWFFDVFGIGRSDRMTTLLERLKEIPSAQPEQRWIPCSERLPEEGEDIIVTYVDDEETRIIPVNYDKGTWYDCIFDTALNPIKVIAWMPLPEPYKEEQE